MLFLLLLLSPDGLNLIEVDARWPAINTGVGIQMGSIFNFCVRGIHETWQH